MAVCTASAFRSVAGCSPIPFLLRVLIASRVRLLIAPVAPNADFRVIACLAHQIISKGDVIQEFEFAPDPKRIFPSRELISISFQSTVGRAQTFTKDMMVLAEAPIFATVVTLLIVSSETLSVISPSTCCAFSDIPRYLYVSWIVVNCGVKSADNRTPLMLIVAHLAAFTSSPASLLMLDVTLTSLSTSAAVFP